MSAAPSSEATAFFRDSGEGAPVVCLHANASSSSQWRALTDRLAGRWRVLAADGYGAGKSPPWPAGRRVALADEARLLEPMLAALAQPFALVGHSYGGAVALVTALRHPQRVRAIVLYEPTLFALVERRVPPPNEVDGIRAVVVAAAAALAAGDADAAARVFIDFWIGTGAWDATPEPRRPPIRAAIVNAQGWADALFGEPMPDAAFAALDVPVLCLVGSTSPASSLSVTRRLAQLLPHVTVHELEGLGHMGPVTHPELVNQAIVDFLERSGR